MTPIETGQSDAAAYEHPLDDRAVVVEERIAATPIAERDQAVDVRAEAMTLALDALKERDALLAVVRRAQAILAEGLATSQSTTARGGPLALGQAAKLALEEINASGVLT